MHTREELLELMFDQFIPVCCILIVIGATIVGVVQSVGMIMHPSTIDCFNINLTRVCKDTSNNTLVYEKNGQIVKEKLE